MGLRAIVGHLSTKVLADYVHLSQATIAQRQGRASLVEQLNNPERAKAETRVLASLRAISALQALPKPDVPRETPTMRATALPASGPRIDSAAIIEAFRTDPGLREALLQALLGGAA